MRLQLPPQMQLASLLTESSRAEKRAAINAHISVLRRESPKFASDLYERRHELLHIRSNCFHTNHTNVSEYVVPYA